MEHTHQTLGGYLRQGREAKKMSAAEVSRVTRIPLSTIDALEADRFGELPGEVFVRGFLKAYAQSVGLLPADVLTRYGATRQVSAATPLPVASPVQVARDGGRRFGVAIAFVLLLILFTLALSIVLKPRGRNLPAELSARPSIVQLARG